MREIVENIKDIRREKGIGQEVIAEALGIDATAVSKLENGKRDLKVDELAKIADCLRVDMLYLITYPDVYVKKSEAGSLSKKISVTFEVDESEKEYLLRLVNKR